MRPQKVIDSKMMLGLVQEFRSRGYEGASLGDLSLSTGLKKASLYHRFPKGKIEMAYAVLSYFTYWVEQQIFIPLKDDTVLPEDRLKNCLAEISNLYDGGSETCIFRAFLLKSGLDLFEKQIKNGMMEWIENFKAIGIALGLNPRFAEEKAIETLVQIQGSLIVSKGISDLGIFRKTLKNIENKYLKG